MVNSTHHLRPECRQRKSDSRGGATTVETVLVLSVWILLLAGTFDLGMAVLRYNTLAHAARQGARQAIVHGKLASPQRTVWGPSKYTGKAGDAHEIPQTVLPYLTGFTASEVTVTVEWIDDGNDLQQRVRFKVSGTYKPVLAIAFGNQPIALSSVSTMPIAH